MTTKLPINLEDLLRQRTVEGERIEYKAGWNPDAIVRTLCAFANDFHNLGGGYIVIGVAEKNGRPVLPPKGLPPDSIDGIQKELLNLGHSAIVPYYHPLSAAYVMDGRTILVLSVPGGEVRPYKARTSVTQKRSDWAYYIRKQTSTVRATGEDKRELLSLAATVPFDDRYNQSATLDELSPQLMKEFLRAVGSDLADDVDVLPREELGRQMNVIGGPSERPFPKNVGLLFFNEAPHHFFPVTQIDVVYFPEGAGGDRFEEKTFQGPLDRITRDAISYIERNYIKETVIKYPDRPEAERLWNFPLAAVEEAVVNAVYHRSYEIREPVEIRVSPEDLVVLSFPGPDRSIRMSDLRNGRGVSRRYRNRRIGEFLKELELTEGRSTGIRKILNAMERNGSPRPEFDTDDDRSYFLVRLPVHTRALQSEPPTPEVTGEGAGEITGKDGVHDTGEVTGEVAGEVERLLHALTSPMTRSEIQMALKLRSQANFRDRYLQPALETGLIEMTIPDKPRSSKQRYRLTDRGKRSLKGGAS